MRLFVVVPTAEADTVLACLDRWTLERREDGTGGVILLKVAMRLLSWS